MGQTPNVDTSKTRTPAGLLTGTATIGELLDLIRSTQGRLSELETEIVGVRVRIGWLFLRLKPGAAGRWPRGVYSLVPNANVARQYRAVGRAFGGERGDADPDLQRFLPGTPSKLVQLARLGRVQLRRLAAVMDFRKATVKEVTAAVAALLGVSNGPPTAGCAPFRGPVADRPEHPLAPPTADPQDVEPSASLGERLARLKAARDADRGRGRDNPNE